MRKTIIVLGITMSLTSCTPSISTRSRPESIQVSIAMKGPTSRIDPATITFHGQYELVQALYATLTQLKPNGQMEPGLAESWKWEGDAKLIFKLRPGPITSKDVDFTFRRLAVLGTNTHGNVAQMLCHGQKLRSVTDPCPGIQIIDEKSLSFDFRTIPPGSYLLDLMTNADFSILPFASVDWSKPGLPIIDYTNTSGAWHLLSHDENKGEIYLSENSWSYLRHDRLPKKIIIRTSSQTDPYQDLKQGLIDVSMTSRDRFSTETLKLIEKDPQLNIYQTFPIKTAYIQFSERAWTRLTVAERWEIARRIRPLFFNSGQFRYEPAYEFFPSPEFGGLTDEARNKITALWKTPDGITSQPVSLKGRNITIWSHKNIDAKWWKFMESEKDFRVTMREQFLEDIPVAEQPDFWVLFADSGFTEDLSLLSYFMKTKSFGYSLKEGEKWLETFQNTESKEDRNKLVRALHERMILNGYLIPIGTSNYAAVTRKNLHFEFSPMFAGSPLWRISFKD